MEYPCAASEMRSLPSFHQLPCKVFDNSKRLFVLVRFKSSCCVPLDISNSGQEKTMTEEESIHVNNKGRIKHYSRLLRTCASKESFNEGRAVHGHLIKNEVEPDSHFWISLINLYAKCGRPAYARKVLAKMPQPDVVSWTALIQGFVGQGNPKEGINLFCEMRREGIRPNEFTIATCLKACSACLNINFGKQVKAEAIKVGLLSDSFIGSALVGLYAIKVGLLSDSFIHLIMKS